MSGEKEPTTTEIVYRWPDGREEVRYRRPYGSEAAQLFIQEVEELKARHDTPYFVRHV